jgi:cholesterol oxidase
MARPRVVVIGSGFGGAITACRLAERGRYEVVLLERGKRYGRNEFPRRPDELREAVWDPDMGRFGLFDYHSFPNSRMDVVGASGLGGGSLIYSNVLYEAPEAAFNGWPGGITRARLDPYYQRVLQVMEARPYPFSDPGSPYSSSLRTRTLVRAAERMGREPPGPGRPAFALEWPKLAVRFGDRVEAESLNAHGALQTSCRLCGECNIGCNTHAKNTLDLNYLRLAENLGVEIRTSAEVREIRPWKGAGYKVLYRDPRHTRPAEELLANRVVLAAGPLGSPHLLLRMKRGGQLPQLSDALGRRWSSNGDLLGLVRNLEEPIHPTTGPVITAALRFFSGGYPDGYSHELYLEDGGYPPTLSWYVTVLSQQRQAWWQSLKNIVAIAASRAAGVSRRLEADDVASLFFPDDELVGRTLVLFGMGRDRPVGRLSVSADLSATDPFDDDDLQLDWDPRPSALHFARTREAMQRLAGSLGGDYLDMSFLTRYISVHPLGGCPMGDSPRDGVVDGLTGEVFGYPGLHVVDGSIMPTAIGPNPSLTIAAVAELFAERINAR